MGTEFETARQETQQMFEEAPEKEQPQMDEQAEATNTADEDAFGAPARRSLEGEEERQGSGAHLRGREDANSGLWLDEPQDLQPEEDKEFDRGPQNEAETQAVLDDAVNAAETASKAAVDLNEQLNQLKEQNSMLMQQNSQLQEGFGALRNQMQQMSEQQKEAIVDEAYAHRAYTGSPQSGLRFVGERSSNGADGGFSNRKADESEIWPDDERPTIDLASLAFADDEEVKRQQDEYAEKMAQYVKRGVMDELSPFVDEAKRGRLEREKTAVIDALSTVPELEGIKSLVPQMDRIIENNIALQSDDIPLDEKYINAYAIARGVNAINTPKKEPTAEDLMRLYEENPEFQEMIEKKRISAVKQNQQVPPMSASSGAVNAALHIKEKPKSWEDASERTKKMFGA